MRVQQNNAASVEATAPLCGIVPIVDGELPRSRFGGVVGLERFFPPGYRVAAPRGGYFLWIACSAAVDSLNVHRQALDCGITIAPGPIFSARHLTPPDYLSRRGAPAPMYLVRLRSLEAIDSRPDS